MRVRISLTDRLNGKLMRKAVCSGKDNNGRKRSAGHQTCLEFSLNSPAVPGQIQLKSTQCTISTHPKGCLMRANPIEPRSRCHSPVSHTTCHRGNSSITSA